MLTHFPFFNVGFSALLTFLFIYSFNILPVSWLSDYGDNSDVVGKQHISVLIWFIPIYVFTFLWLFLIVSIDSSLPKTFLYLAILFLFVHISISDILYMIIPDQHVALLVLLGFSQLSYGNFTNQLLGLLLGVLPFFLIFFIGTIFKQPDSIGFGDIKLMGSLGFLVGAFGILEIYFVSSLLSGIFSALLLTVKMLQKNKSIPTLIPLAPFICFSTGIYFFG